MEFEEPKRVRTVIHPECELKRLENSSKEIRMLIS